MTIHHSEKFRLHSNTFWHVLHLNHGMEMSGEAWLFVNVQDWIWRSLALEWRAGVAMNNSQRRKNTFILTAGMAVHHMTTLVVSLSTATGDSEKPQKTHSE